MPDALERKYPRAGSSWAWFWLFPQDKLSADPRSGVVRRHHLYEQTFQRAYKRAVQQARVLNAGHAPHAAAFLRDASAAAVRLRHPDGSGPPRTANVVTTMIYTHVLRVGGGGVRNPLDALALTADPTSLR